MDGWELHTIVQPLVMDTLTKDEILSIKDTLRGPLSIILVHLNLQREDNLPIKDTLRGPLSIILVHLNLQREDNLSIKDKMAGPKRVPYSEFLLYVVYWVWNMYEDIPLSMCLWCL